MKLHIEKAFQSKNKNTIKAKRIIIEKRKLITNNTKDQKSMQAHLASLGFYMKLFFPFSVIYLKREKYLFKIFRWIPEGWLPDCLDEFHARSLRNLEWALEFGWDQFWMALP